MIEKYKAHFLFLLFRKHYQMVKKQIKQYIKIQNYAKSISDKPTLFKECFSKQDKMMIENIRKTAKEKFMEDEDISEQN